MNMEKTLHAFGVHHLPFYLFLLIGLLVFWALVRANRDPDNNINLLDLLRGEEGTISRAACVMLASWGVTTWGMIYMWLGEKMTEGYFAAYLAAWVAPAVTKLIVNANVETARAKGPTPPAQPPIIGNAGSVQVAASPASGSSATRKEYRND